MSAGVKRPFAVGARVTGLLFVILFSGCKEITDPPTAVLRGIVSLTAATDAFADATTLVRVEARIDTSLHGDARAVKFTTSAALFGDKAEAIVRADTAGIAVAQLRAPSDTSTAIVTASAGISTLRIELRFRRATPDRIDVDPAQFVLEAGAAKEVNITATLRRDTGSPTPGAVVSFSARDSTGAPIGRFSSAARSGTGGTVIVRYSAGDTSYRGAVTITASTDGAAGTISGSTIVKLIDPK